MGDQKVKGKLDAAAGKTTRSDTGVHAHGYLMKVTDGPTDTYRLYSSPFDRHSYLEFNADAVDDVGEKNEDGSVEVTVKPDAIVRRVAREHNAPAKLLSGVVASQMSSAVAPAVQHNATFLAVTAPTNCGPARTHCSTCAPGCGYNTRGPECGDWPLVPTDVCSTSIGNC